MAMDGKSLPCIASNLNLCFPVTGFSNVVGGLHPKKGIHLRAKSLLDPQCHVRRERSAAVQKGRERGPAHVKNLGGLGNGEIERLGDSILMNCPGWAGRAMRIMALFPLIGNPHNPGRRFLPRSGRF